jgi:hypothetical protein
MMTQRKAIVHKRPGLQNISSKVMVMAVLLTVMGILWGRVLLKGDGSPAAAKAQEMAQLQETLADAAPETVQIEAVQLPVLPGRNDALSNDLFSSENWNVFELSEKQSDRKNGVTVGQTGDSFELAHRSRLERIAERLTLEAVICDAQNRPFQAFVEDKVLSVGSTLTVQEGPDKYVLLVEKISQKEVSFSWNEMSVVLKMAETFEL